MSSYEKLPGIARILILSFLETADLEQMLFVSKQSYDECHHPINEVRLMPTYEITPVASRSHPRYFTTMHQILGKLRVNTALRHESFGRYRKLRLNRHNDLSVTVLSRHIDAETLEGMKDPNFGFVLKHIVSLDLSTDYPLEAYGPTKFWNAVVLSSVLPNLKELDLTGCNSYDDHATLGGSFGFCVQCPNLQVIKWNRKQYTLDGLFYPSLLSGHALSSAGKVKELCFDDGIFHWKEDERQMYTSMEDDNDKYLFSKANLASLERFSLKNARQWILVGVDPDRVKERASATLSPVPQEALIRFVRNAPPTLKWFRSDLSAENIAMLQAERPTMKLVNE